MNLFAQAGMLVEDPGALARALQHSAQHGKPPHSEHASGECAVVLTIMARASAAQANACPPPAPPPPRTAPALAALPAPASVAPAPAPPTDHQLQPDPAAPAPGPNLAGAADGGPPPPAAPAAAPGTSTAAVPARAPGDSAEAGVEGEGLPETPPRLDEGDGEVAPAHPPTPMQVLEPRSASPRAAAPRSRLAPPAGPPASHGGALSADGRVVTAAPQHAGLLCAVSPEAGSCASGAAPPAGGAPACPAGEAACGRAGQEAVGEGDAVPAPAAPVPCVPALAAPCVLRQPVVSLPGTASLIGHETSGSMHGGEQKRVLGAEVRMF